MPLTRLANSAVDGVRGREAAVRADIVTYAGRDLLCYRATEPEGWCAGKRSCGTRFLPGVARRWARTWRSRRV